jgi:hypothetical protein
VLEHLGLHTAVTLFAALTSDSCFSDSSSVASRYSVSGYKGFVGSAAHVSRKSNKLPLQVVQDSMVAFIRSCMTSILQPFGQTVDELQKWHGRGNIFDGFCATTRTGKTWNCP